MKKCETINGVIVTKQELESLGFNFEAFNYYVDVSIVKKDKTILFKKFKAVESDEGKATYFKEVGGNVLMFDTDQNPNMKIKKLLLN